MKKTTHPITRLLLLALLAAAVCAISGCAGSGKADPDADYIDFKEASDTYTVKDAEKAGYLVVSHMKITSGQDAWDDFLARAQQGRPARIRIARTYGSAKDEDETPILLTEVEYDGKAYIRRDCYDATVSEDTFRSLLRFEGNPPQHMPSSVSVISYVLADDDSLTWDQAKEILDITSSTYNPEMRQHCRILYHYYTQYKEDYIDLKTASETYSVKDAEAAGYVIIAGLQVTAGQKRWDDFVLRTESGKPAKIRILHHDPSGMLNNNSDPDTQSYITEVEFDGEKYISRSFKHGQLGKLHEEEYRYMMRYEGKPESPHANYGHYLRYVLVNDNTVTWEDIERGMLSSQSGDYIPHEEVYTDLTSRKAN